METIIAAVISGIFGLITGFAGGYTFSLKVNKKQKQTAGKNSVQFQVGEINDRK